MAVPFLWPLALFGGAWALNRTGGASSAPSSSAPPSPAQRRNRRKFAKRVLRKFGDTLDKRRASKEVEAFGGAMRERKPDPLAEILRAKRKRKRKRKTAQPTARATPAPPSSTPSTTSTKRRRRVSKRAKRKARAAAASPPTASSSPERAAAAELFNYVTKTETNPRKWGTRAAPNRAIKLLQGQMGEIVADGIYGPATRGRGKQLLGKTFPARR